jgi:hypothetical protein
LNKKVAVRALAAPKIKPLMLRMSPLEGYLAISCPFTAFLRSVNGLPHCNRIFARFCQCVICRVQTSHQHFFAKRSPKRSGSLGKALSRNRVKIGGRFPADQITSNNRASTAFMLLR